MAQQANDVASEEEKSKLSCLLNCLSSIGTFKRPIGASADVKELEYISSLHQTQLGKLRKDGSITAEDVVHFLSSRYGIIVTKEAVSKQIFSGLGGSDSDGECLDITELVAVLLIPLLLKAEKTTSNVSGPDSDNTPLIRVQTDQHGPVAEKLIMPSTPNVIGEVAHMMLSDVTKKNSTGAAAASDAPTTPTMIATTRPMPLPTPMELSFSSSTADTSQSVPLATSTEGTIVAPMPPPVPPPVPPPDGVRESSTASSSPTGAATIASTWTCTVCTLVNDNETKSCSACDTPRPDSNTASSIFRNHENKNNFTNEVILTGPMKIVDETEHTSTYVPFNEHSIGTNNGDNHHNNNKRNINNSGSDDGLINNSNSNDSNNTHEDVIIDKDFIKRILLHFGEVDLANNKRLVQEMFLCITGGEENVVFNGESLARALTSDTKEKYDLSNEYNITTNYYDVFQTHYSTSTEGLSPFNDKLPLIGKNSFDNNNNNNDTNNTSSIFMSPSWDDSNNGNQQAADAEIPSNRTSGDDDDTTIPVKKVYTAPEIDYSIDNYRSKLFTVLLWAFFVMTLFAYLPNPTTPIKWLNCLEQEETSLLYEQQIYEDQFVIVGNTYTYKTTSFLCKVTNRIIHWFVIAITLCIGGLFFMFVGSLGNSIYSQSYSKRVYIVSSAVMAFIAILPFVLTSDGNPLIELEEANNNFISEINNVISINNHTLASLGANHNNSDTSSNFQPNANIAAFTNGDNDQVGDDYGGYRVSDFRRWPALVLGLIVVFMQLFALASLHYSQKYGGQYIKNNQWLKNFVVHGNILSESKMKKAAAYKIDAMVKHAREMHGSLFPTSDGNDTSDDDQQQANNNKDKRSGAVPFPLDSTLATSLLSSSSTPSTAASATSSPTSSSIRSSDANADHIYNNMSYVDRALIRFEKGVGSELFERVRCGGFFWTWKMIFTDDLTRKEGIWISSRIIVGNIAQLIISFVVLAFGISETHYQLWIIRAEGIGTDNENAVSSDRIVVDSLRWAGWVGSIVGFVACLYIASAAIPSAATTALKFRCGLYSSLHDNSRMFKRYRVAPDSVSSLVGSMLWGSFFAGIGIFVFFALVTFLILFPLTREWFTNLLATLIGFTITLVIKIIILFLSRRVVYQGLYRSDPSRANFMVLALECWNVGLGFGFMFARIIKLLLVTLFFVGRVDAPIVAHDQANLGPIELDNISIIFRRDIVSHEAHRHPYLETLGVMYMMKLRHGTAFANRAGSAWRLLFVFALMPWLRSYRVLTKYGLEEEEEEDYDNEEKNNISDDRSTANVRLLAENVRLRQQLEVLSRRNLHDARIY